MKNVTWRFSTLLAAFAIASLPASCVRSQSVALDRKTELRAEASNIKPSSILPANSQFISQNNSALTYNPKTPPQFQNSRELQTIVDEIVASVRSKKLPTDALSITLIDAKTGSIAGFQPDALRYPASVVKLFWMVDLEAQITSGQIDNRRQIQPYLHRMLEHSDNDAAAYILDRVTDTRSQKRLATAEFQTWLQKRQRVNDFFRQAGYSNININQKTFPVYSIGMTSPQGTDLQMRGNPRVPIRNKITTNHAGRLMYEISQKRAISSAASQQMQSLLTRNLDPRVWKNKKNYPGFNPVRGFLGEGLVGKPVRFASKAGWTSGTRGEAAYISTTDGQTAYIIAIIGDDRAYASSGQLFPQISRFVYDRLTKLE